MNLSLIHISTLLSLGWELSEQQILRPFNEDSGDAPYMRMALRLDEPMLILRHNNATLSLRYQPRYRPLRASAAGPGSLDRHTRVPDLALELLRPGQPPRLLIFDAKYRLASDGQAAPMDALDDAYAYLGALGYAGQPITQAA